MNCTNCKSSQVVILACKYCSLKRFKAIKVNLQYKNYDKICWILKRSKSNVKIISYVTITISMHHRLCKRLHFIYPMIFLHFFSNITSVNHCQNNLLQWFAQECKFVEIRRVIWYRIYVRFQSLINVCFLLASFAPLSTKEEILV